MKTISTLNEVAKQLTNLKVTIEKLERDYAAAKSINSQLTKHIEFLNMKITLLEQEKKELQEKLDQKNK